MTILMFYVCLFYMLMTTSLRKMTRFLTNEQRFVGTSLHQHSSSYYSIFVFNLMEDLILNKNGNEFIFTNLKIKFRI